MNVRLEKSVFISFLIFLYVFYRECLNKFKNYGSSNFLLKSHTLVILHWYKVP